MNQIHTYQNIKEVPWYRRSSLNSFFVIVGAFVFQPLLWITIFSIITGDIYFNKKNPDGTLKTWSTANKVVAFMFLIVQIIIFIFFIA